MSRRPNASTKRLERRAERQARQPGAAQRPRRQRQNQTPARRRPRSPIRINWIAVLALLGAAAVVGLLVYAVLANNTPSDSPAQKAQKAEQDSSASIPGAYVAPHPGFDGIYGTSDDRQHFGNGIVYPICTPEQIASNQVSSPMCYTSNPPTSGPHAQNPLTFKVLDNPAPKENLLHNMEHGGVVIWYNTENEDVIRQLAAITSTAVDQRRLVVMSKYTEMEPDTVAVTSWTRLDKFPVSEFNRKRVTDFIAENNKRFNPEGF